MRILFIEDDAMNRRVVRDMLHVAGLELAEADGGRSGIARLMLGSVAERVVRVAPCPVTVVHEQGADEGDPVLTPEEAFAADEAQG